MAAKKPGLIALFDVDGTLTAPRKVFIFTFMLLHLFNVSIMFENMSN